MSAIPEKPYCESHYLPRDDKFVTCDEFGCSDGMNGKCWNCREMTLYQWFMCQDAGLLKLLLDRNYSQEEAEHSITEHKRLRHPYPPKMKEGKF